MGRPSNTGIMYQHLQYSSFWVGIDGFSSGTVEQTGTDSDCQNGVPTYYAWYEFYPHPSFLISGLIITPGDHITAQASLNGRSFVVTITDTTTNHSFSTSAKVRGAQRSSAEWITEAPSSSGGILPLADGQLLSLHGHRERNHRDHRIFRVLGPSNYNGNHLRHQSKLSHRLYPATTGTVSP